MKGGGLNSWRPATFYTVDQCGKVIFTCLVVDADKNTFMFHLVFRAVENLLTVPVKSYVEIDQRIQEGTRNRTVASTNMNATSRCDGIKLCSLANQAEQENWRERERERERERGREREGEREREKERKTERERETNCSIRCVRRG